MLTFLIGGARSGKSALALRLASVGAAAVTFIATADAGDEEMAARIALHRAERPCSWETLEERLHLDHALGGVAEETTVVIDCLTLWVANLMEAGHDDAAVTSAAHAVACRAARRSGPVIAVSNEVGSGLVPLDPLSRRYRDLLGRVNAAFAQQAGAAFLVVAGLVLPLAGAPVAGDDRGPTTGAR